MVYKDKIDLGNNKVIEFETGRLAKEAGGAVVVRLGDTMVLATATSSNEPRPGIDFFPLLVDFEEKLYAAGKIPGGFFKREGKPTEKSILTARLIDRPIRPLFPEGYRNDVQLLITPLSVDQENPPDILGMIAASTALTISDVPFEGPLGSIRISKVDGKFVVLPTIEEIKKSEMNIIVSGLKDAVMMIEAGASEVSNEDVNQALNEAQKVIDKLIDFQNNFAKKAGKQKKAITQYVPNNQIEEFAKKEGQKQIEKALQLTDNRKQKEELKKIKNELTDKIKKDEKLAAIAKENPHDLKNILDSIEKHIVRDMILNKGQRIDGRKSDQLRELDAEVGILPRVHGSSIFSRGQTQVMNIVTLGSAGEEQILDGLELDDETKRYMHHYNFPAFSVGEVRPSRGPGRREIGHGALAEKALLPVIPSEEKFPYTIRLVSEVLGSNGSTSMASTCASTLALMDAGVPIKAPVAGISIGLVKEGNKAVTLTDIQGLEDHFGDMDFKVAGTRNGITAIQLDVKTKGLTLALAAQAIEQAKKARDIILDKIESTIKNPRNELSPFAPQVITLQINPEKIGMVIGPGGKNIKKIIEVTGVKIDIEDDGKVVITSNDAEGMKKAQQIIKDMTFDVEVGQVLNGKVVRVAPFGAFVEVAPGQDGLLHISQIADYRVNKVEDEINVGDEFPVKVIEIDDSGRFKLSKKAVEK